MAKSNKKNGKQTIEDIKRNTRRKFGAEEKIRIVLDGLRGEDSISEVCRKEGIYQSQYYTWSKDFMEAGKKRLNGDSKREASSIEVKDLKKENEQLKSMIAELLLHNRILKKSLKGLD